MSTEMEWAKKSKNTATKNSDKGEGRIQIYFTRYNITPRGGSALQSGCFNILYYLLREVGLTCPLQESLVEYHNDSKIGGYEFLNLYILGFKYMHNLYFGLLKIDKKKILNKQLKLS